MKCPNCGSETSPSEASCASCGRPLPGSKKARSPGTPPGQAPRSQQTKDERNAGPVAKLNHADVAKKLRFDYAYGPKEHIDKLLSGLDPLFAAYRKPKARTRNLLELSANIIYRHLRIREVSIGLRDPKDGLYRYEVMAGMNVGKWRAHEGLAYTKEDFSRNDKWKGTMISRYTKLMLAEDNPYHEGEEDTVDRHEMIASKRHGPEDSIEGDYMDIMIQGLNDELIGWIEISGTWTSKLPDPQTIRLVELVACTLGSMLSARAAPDGPGK